MHLVDLMAGAGLIVTLSALALIDARTFRLPDSLTLPLIAAGLVFALVWRAAFLPYVAGAALGYLSMVAIELAYKRLRARDGLGRGDAKLFAAGGAWCGAAALPMILLVASLTALLFVAALRCAGRPARADTAIAFGPFLAIGVGGAWIVQPFA